MDLFRADFYMQAHMEEYAAKAGCGPHGGQGEVFAVRPEKAPLKVWKFFTGFHKINTFVW